MGTLSLLAARRGAAGFRGAELRGAAHQAGSAPGGRPPPPTPPPLWPLPIRARCPSWKCSHPAQPSGSTRPRAPVGVGSAPPHRPQAVLPISEPRSGCASGHGPGPGCVWPSLHPPGVPAARHLPCSSRHCCHHPSPRSRDTAQSCTSVHKRERPDPEHSRGRGPSGDGKKGKWGVRPGRGGPAMTRGTGRSSALPPQACRLPSPETSCRLDISLFHPRHRGWGLPCDTPRPDPRNEDPLRSCNVEHRPSGFQGGREAKRREQGARRSPCPRPPPASASPSRWMRMKFPWG